MVSGDLYELTIKAEGSSAVSVCTASHVDLWKVVESILFAAVRGELYRTGNGETCAVRAVQNLWHCTSSDRLPGRPRNFRSIPSLRK